MGLARTGNGLKTPPLVTLTLFGFDGGARAWAFTQMGLARRHIAGTRGLRFWQLLGSGHGGSFSLRPDWGRYGLLCVWESNGAASEFFAESVMFARYRDRAREVWTARLAPVSGHGAWGGVNPFEPYARSLGSDGPVAVLTRATIRWRGLRAFWSAVPAASQAVDGAEGLVASIGVGESPFVRQATFSVWRSVTEMQTFAYHSPAHREVIRRTRDEGWYSEELFTRFALLASEGSWNGRDPLEGLLS